MEELHAARPLGPHVASFQLPCSGLVAILPPRLDLLLPLATPVLTSGSPGDILDTRTAVPAISFMSY